MAVHGPALKALGASVGLSLEDGVRGLLDGVMPPAEERPKATTGDAGISACAPGAAAVTVKSNGASGHKAE